jgi:EAL domain-containing protein (putative c-di-GMP-specific phosphodiesterase class I)
VPAEPPAPPVDVAEALGAGWLELWYQPKIDARSLALGGAEALIRMRHPSWGIVPPAYFIPDEGDPHFRSLSRFVIDRMFQDWRYLVAKAGSIHMSINLPLAFFTDANAVDDLRLQFPDHPAFDGLTVEVDSSDVVKNLPLAIEAAQRLRFHNIGFSLDDVGTEWPALAALNEFPFAEIKLDRQFVDGSSSARLKRSVCRRIVDLAKSHGVKTVAEGVETRDDFLAMHGIGVDFIQGFLFGKPMTTRKVARNSRQPPAFAPVA